MKSNAPRQCIYCRHTKPATLFTTEHVIQEAFGKFGSQTFVLDCVCGDCNQRFGNTIDLALGRDSALGLLRYSVGVSDPKDFKPPTRHARVSVTINESGPDFGATAKLAIRGDGTWFEREPSLGFAEAEKGPFTYFPIESLPSRPELLKLGRHLRAAGGVTRKMATEALLAKGIRCSLGPDLPAPRSAKLESEFTVPQRRAIAKVAMNYLAHVAGAEVALRSEFDDIRAYINGERDPGSFVCGHPRGPETVDDGPRRGYALTLQPMNDEIVVLLSMVSALFMVRLARAPFLIRGAPVGHFFDLDRCTVEKLSALPSLHGTRIRRPLPGEGMHLHAPGTPDG